MCLSGKPCSQEQAQHEGVAVSEVELWACPCLLCGLLHSAAFRAEGFFELCRKSSPFSPHLFPRLAASARRAAFCGRAGGHRRCSVLQGSLPRSPEPRARPCPGTVAACVALCPQGRVESAAPRIPWDGGAGSPAPAEWGFSLGALAGAWGEREPSAETAFLRGRVPALSPAWSRSSISRSRTGVAALACSGMCFLSPAGHRAGASAGSLVFVQGLCANDVGLFKFI